MKKYSKKNKKFPSSRKNTIKYRGGVITTFLDMYNNNQLGEKYRLIIPKGTTEYYPDRGGVYMNVKREKTQSIQKLPILRVNSHKIGELRNNSTDFVTKFSVERDERTRTEYLKITDYHIKRNEVITQHFYKATDVIVDENNEILDCNIKEYVKNYLSNGVLPTFLRGKLIGQWDVSNVTDMNCLFQNFAQFNEYINGWNVHNVTNMEDMFSGCEEFNQPLNRWIVRQVTNMEGMFNNCLKFNQPLNNWNVSKVTNMNRMFNECINFNNPLDEWDVHNVTDMKEMFSGCEQFNQRLDEWDVSQVTDMNGMFYECINFNKPLNRWNVSQVTDMGFMFIGCEQFNQPLNGWNVSQVTNMEGMFSRCENFNKPLNEWDVSEVTNMSFMFQDCTRFNQPLNGWDINQNTNVTSMFQDCNISPANKPNLVVRRPPRPVDVDPYQIHKESSKINYKKLNTVLTEFMIEEIPDFPPPPPPPSVPENIPNTDFPPPPPSALENIPNTDFPRFFKNTFTSMIDTAADTSEEKKNELRAKLERIMNERLNRLNYKEINQELLETAIKMVNYANQQDEPLKTAYVTTFVEDCVTAYEGSDGMTCVMGALERIFFSFVTAASIVDINHPEWKQIVNCIVVNIKDTIIEYIKEWYKLHKMGTTNAFSKEITNEKRRDDLRGFLISKYPGEGELIDKQIKDYADNIGYDDDDFMYGGRKWRPITRKQLRNTRKRNRTQKIHYT